MNCLEINQVITHPGGSHRDEFIAICLLLAMQKKMYEKCMDSDPALEPWVAPFIERKEPSPEELKDPHIAVIDVGGVYKPEEACFDHHQFPKGTKLCALSLILQEFGLIDAAGKASGWLEWTETLDSCGPMAVMQQWDIGKKAFYASMSPIEAQILLLFSAEKRLGAEHPLVSLMTSLGGGWMTYWEKWACTTKGLNCGGASLHSLPAISGGYALVIQEEPGTYVLGAVEAWIEEWEAGNPGLAIVGSITKSDRNGEGWALYRRNDHFQIDFRRINGMEGVAFVHSNGFIAKTEDISLPLSLDLFEAACFCPAKANV